MRAVAVLMVVAFHAGLSIPGGFTGVDVFFVISGFVITALLLRELDSDGRLSLADFYARRVRRILPASALTISFVAIASIAAISTLAQQTTARTGLAGSVFVSNVVLGRQRTGYFDIKLTSNPLLHIWSLSVEEQFYLVFPVILVGAYLLAHRWFPNTEPRRVVASVVGTIAAVSFALCWYATYSSYAISRDGGLMAAIFPGRAAVSGAQLAFYLAPMRAWEFAVGALLAVGVPAIKRLPGSVAQLAAWGGTALVVLAAFGISDATPFPGVAVLLPVAGSALLIVAGTVRSNVVSRFLAVKPMTRIGDLSYSWYLWHWPLIVFASALFPMEQHAPLIAAIVSIVPAWLSFKYLETPLRLDTRIKGRRAVRVAAICIAVPIVCSLVLLRAPKPPRSAATAAFLKASNSAHLSETHDCNRGIPLGLLAKRCIWAVPHARGRVVLLGDSNAGHFSEPVLRAAKQHGFDLAIDSLPECPFVDLIVSHPLTPAFTERCRRFVTGSLRQLVASKPSLVVLAASTPFYFIDDTKFRDPVSGREASSLEEKARLWSAGLGRTLERLIEAGIPTAVVHTVPQWKTWDSRSCAEARVYLAPTSCGTTQTVREAEDFLRRSLNADRVALRAVPAAIGVDLISDLCSGRQCSTNNGNRWRYKDGRHLSVQGALRLAPRFGMLIDEVERRASEQS